jgi:cysteine desulfurase
MTNEIYLDYASTSPMWPEVLEAMTPFLTTAFGNPSSVHGFGREARKAVEFARGQVASALGAQPREICFTSGGTESDNWAIRGAALARQDRGRHLITTRVEHPAVLNTMRALEKQGWEVTRLPVDAEGRVDPREVKRAIRGDTVLISVMTANNEIGTLQPVEEIGRIAREADVLFHTDAVQAVGAIPVCPEWMEADLLSLSGHKFHGPKGIGVLYVRQGTILEPLITGGEQERRMRAGTEHVAGIVGLGKAIELAAARMPENSRRIRALRDLLIREVLEGIPDAVLNGPREARLPGNASFSFRGIDGEALLLRLDLAGIAASSGSACTSGSLEPSHVLEAVGQAPELIKGSLRLSLGAETTESEIRQVTETLTVLVKELRAMRHIAV